ncbi:MAG: radical SAM domain-containing protein, partial [Pseudarthrobacter sp.]|nr:radical SAM domain-containing protein [Pseudarthrobacter sp.]
RIPWQGTQFGDTRCNRTALVLRAGGTLAPLIDPDDPDDIDARDRLLAEFGGMYFGGTPHRIVAAKIIRALLTHPADVPVVLRFGLRLAQRAGGMRRILAAARAGELSFRTFVVHNFMDAADVAPAWNLMGKGVASEDPKTREVQERLGACMYTMSHPDTGQLVPACAQHSVMDPAENAGLRKLLPLTPREHGASRARP